MIDQELLELRGVRANRQIRRRPQLDRQSRFQIDNSPNEFCQIDWFLLRRRQTGEARIGLHETAERFGARRDHIQTAARIILPIRRRRLALQKSFQDCRRSI